ncbi:helix-turn-helix transcriptional regulator [Lentisphaerota bacterium ZTH]|nr:helix-turn-helix domain-containing protein [Lentisphaerota bacterium]WET05926.1 helix-turn-helix transcriptional regulator [Lentisphaerota bacterium ZTH]
MGNHKSVSSMLDNMLGDSKITEGVQKKVEETKIVHELVKQRIRAGKTQADIAESWGCDPATISRFEDKKDDDIKLGDLARYCNAIGTGVGVHIAPPVHSRAAALVSCVKEIDIHLKELTKLAKEYSDDEIIVDGITKFQANVLLDILKNASSHTDDLIERIELVKPADDCIETSCEAELLKV